MAACAAGHRGRLQRRSWSRLLLPGQPMEVPRLSDAALRLTGAALAPGAARAEEAAELRITVPGRVAAGGKEFVLARLAGRYAGGLPVARLRALVSCAEGAVLSVAGQPLWVVGRLEGALPPNMSTPASSQPAPTPRAGLKGPPRPKSEDEYLCWLEDHLRKEGRTPLRKLGAAVQRPKGTYPRKLKMTLLKYRSRFTIDLHGCVDINHSRRWRWEAQPAVTRVRRSIEHEH
mmetsp:Transcript_87033/g.281812  ORF Transcript_87033/g.281812 Transcript_87033/m.281812 type:complete len:232 (+) Transcript_87033:79-774(+)